jgi:hypothetical protein
VQIETVVIIQPPGQQPTPTSQPPAIVPTPTVDTPGKSPIHCPPKANAHKCAALWDLFWMY